MIPDRDVAETIEERYARNAIRHRNLDRQVV